MDNANNNTENTSHAHYLIDLENTSCRWANIIPKLNEGDTITIFMSGSTGKMNNEALCSASKKGAKFRFLFCNTGHANAMDFQLVTELGRLSVQRPHDIYYMVSEDKGFDVVESYLQDLNIAAIRLDPCDATESECEPACMHTHPVLPDLHDVIQNLAQDKDINTTSQPDTEPKIAEPEQPRNTRQTYFLMLQGAGISKKEDLHIATEILCEAMKLQSNKRKMEVLNRFRSHYGFKDGTERYKQIRELVFQIADNGPFPQEEYITPVQEDNMPKETPVTKAAQTAPPIAAPMKKTYRTINHSGVNNILSAAGVVMTKGLVGKVVECIEYARQQPNPQESLRIVLNAYLTKEKTNKVIPKLALKYL